ncbi:MAG TPA: dihydroorotase [Phycisphaerales bacterium]|nr:dihydroorotase [Phycisphaerales bacterium]
METLLIANGRVIDPVSRTDRVCDVAVKDGVIAEIGAGLTRTPAARVIDAAGCIVTPGLIDPHVHLREPGHEHKETIATGTAAAVSGGFTSVCCMPNTGPALDSPEVLALVQQRAAQTGVCRVFPVAAATKGRRGEELTEVHLLREAGAVAYSDDGDCVPTAGMMSRVLAAVAPTGLCFMQHCQDPTMTKGSAMHAGAVAVRLGLAGWPRAAEEVIIERDVRLNKGVRCRYHAQHISSAGSVDILRRARAEGQPVTGEASPHHLSLTHECCDGYNTLGKVNPPVREKSDITGLIEGIVDGTITVLATDHAPHSADEKALPFEEAPFGMVGLETALPIYIEALVRSGAIDWAKLVAMLTSAPAALCGLDAFGFGALRVGGNADVTVIDPEMAWTCRAEDLVSKSKNTPFGGWKLKGRAVLTVVGGVVRCERARQGGR